MTSVEVVSLLWPGLAAVATVQLCILIRPPSTKASQLSLIAIVAVATGIIYQTPILRTIVRWLLTVFGLAVPLAVSYISVQYIVEEV